MKVKTALVAATEIKDDSARGFSVTVNDDPLELFVVNRSGNFYAYLNKCPHVGGELNWRPDQFLDVDCQHIECGMHGALFKIEDGYCIYGPCLGHSLTPLEIELIDGMITLLSDSKP
ncbi:hypothetical protein BOW53_12705 [Solemya pervernicosa gill symbiont]|uniref:Rieske domain-containing protein n=2 Tax=Gammaproteobacteria incertae sedis TaxID=118884 RepID=A0A1T2L2H8_9GAMM|nr:Rieske 2Fe-2S domain-containing protein [Candidatus Reidiella endopervernicosa]OOZ39156.1 hypothetical protein BOW53_12705 [Solemya pervernicosa gill symbiont]QKQ28018.1 Rieske 2Fe-2S domain-containing protein [Candidatus Reidiella endopervernicosa]